MDSVSESRLHKLRRALGASEAAGILITNFTNVSYLTGFSGDDSYLLVTPDQQIILSDPRYTTQLQQECPGLELVIRQPGSTMLASIQQVVHSARLSSLAVEADSLSLARYQQLSEALPKTQLVPISGLVESLRIIKDRGEIAEIRRSIEMAERVFEVLRAGLRGEQTERELANELEYQIRLFGGRGCSFPPIVAAGPQAALPHARPTEQRIGEQKFVLFDWGARAGPYVSDLTRVLAISKISPKLEHIYGVVLQAQLAAIAAVRPGVSLGEVDAAARNIISQAGYGKHFGHGLGHGIGLEIHEAPRIAAQEQSLLQAGMVITIEPGIYLPGWGGVRIEDDVLVTRDGHEVLSGVPKELDRCIVTLL